MAEPFELRKAALAQAALKRRVDWVLSNWEEGPRLVTKAEVVECARAHGSAAVLAPSPHPPPPLLTSDTAQKLREAVSSVCELLNGMSGIDEARFDAAPTSAMHVTAATAEHRRAGRRSSDSSASLLSSSEAELPQPEASDASIAESHDAAEEAAPTGVAASSSSSDLINLLCAPGAADLVEQLRNFVVEFTALDIPSLLAQQPDHVAGFEADAADPPLDEKGSPPRRRGAGAAVRPPQSPGERVRAFLTKAEAALRAHTLGRRLAATPATWAVAVDDLEKVLMCALHRVTWRAHPAADARDTALHARLVSMRATTTWASLEVATPPAALDAGWAVAGGWLREMDAFRAPTDKLRCILNACRVVSTQLAFAAESAGKSGAVGADDFLPALIYTVVRAAPPRLYSNLAHVGEFLRPSAHMSEGGFYYTNVGSAVYFALSSVQRQAAAEPAGGALADAAAGQGASVDARRRAALSVRLATARGAAEAHAAADMQRAAKAEATAAAAIAEGSAGDAHPRGLAIDTGVDDAEPETRDGTSGISSTEIRAAPELPLYRAHSEGGLASLRQHESELSHKTARDMRTELGSDASLRSLLVLPLPPLLNVSEVGEAVCRPRRPLPMSPGDDTSWLRQEFVGLLIASQGSEDGVVETMRRAHLSALHSVLAELAHAVESL